ncbi:VOC family protein [Nocardia cyriacigeorgica]|uniref:VOC family protein n=1 Tax=Nocardia cyriacigeorgica TaxID=135487 RepID=A0A6P1D0M1_9NOCA|nr:VOC family protein [Nocardia cyriacigeorgica]NEW43144.1 VOC family protein [Nocardia cyriacigeorgica]NEW49718.1 VOC family protein [Nocardia cyriacigeorgica]NEW56001.1 VOC family protein [Nocardia cyriacigeorgica]
MLGHASILTAVPQLRVVGLSLDSADPESLAQFYLDLLGGKTLWRKESSVGVRISSGLALVAHRVADHQRPTWPGSSIVHLDLAADDDRDLDECVDRAVELGATVAPMQPGDRWRVLLDPSGHPFCITTVTPPE